MLTSKHNSLFEWRKADPKGYNSARKQNMLLKICKMFDWEMSKIIRKPRGYWTLEKCKVEALKYKTKSKWEKLNKGSYQSAVKNDWLEECCQHMLITTRKPKGYWTLEKCKVEALKYKTKIEWQKLNKGSYLSAVKNGWLEECCQHMLNIRKLKGYWTLERCKEEALKYKRKIEWRKLNKGSYQSSVKNGWLEECCQHMKVHGK